MFSRQILKTNTDYLLYYFFIIIKEIMSLEIYKYKAYDLNCLCFECVALNNYCKGHRCEYVLSKKNDIKNIELIIHKLLLETLCDPLNTYFLCHNELYANYIIFRGPAYKLLYYIILTRVIDITSDVAIRITEFI
jgi:hypothetical protein